MNKDFIKVGLSDLKLASPPKRLRTLGLGSCVGIVLYDEITKISGLSHPMLPSSGEIRDNGNKLKFVDTSIEVLLDSMIRSGAKREGIVAKIAGGGKMFNFQGKTSALDIGRRNIEASKEKLKSLGIELTGEDIGGNYGRTIVFDPETGLLHIKTPNKIEKII